MLSVANLRKAGFQVEVQHNRVRLGEEVLPQGGQTTVKIITPNGKTLSGEALCSDKDNYCKRKGVEYALERAFLNAFLTKSKKLTPKRSSNED